MSNNQFQNNNVRNNITHSRVTRLWGRNEEGSASSFNLYVTNNALRIQIYTGLNEDKQKRTPSIYFSFKDGQIPSVLTILSMLRDLPTRFPDNEPKTIKCPVFGFTKKQGEPKASRTQIGEILIGRDKKGVYWISAIDNIHGKVRFPFTLDRDIKIYNVNTNEEADEAYISECVMKSWVDNTLQIIANVLTQEYVEPEAKDDNKGKGGYNNQKSNQSSNGNSNFDNFDDDFLP